MWAITGPNLVTYHSKVFSVLLYSVGKIEKMIVTDGTLKT